MRREQLARPCITRHTQSTFGKASIRQCHGSPVTFILARDHTGDEFIPINHSHDNHRTKLRAGQDAEREVEQYNIARDHLLPFLPLRFPLLSRSGNLAKCFHARSSSSSSHSLARADSARSAVSYGVSASVHSSRMVTSARRLPLSVTDSASFTLPF